MYGIIQSCSRSQKSFKFINVHHTCVVKVVSKCFNYIKPLAELNLLNINVFKRLNFQSVVNYFLSLPSRNLVL